MKDTKQITYSKDFIQELYRQNLNGLSVSDLSEHYFIARSTIYRNFKRFGYKVIRATKQRRSYATRFKMTNEMNQNYYLNEFGEKINKGHTYKQYLAQSYPQLKLSERDF